MAVSASMSSRVCVKASGGVSRETSNVMVSACSTSSGGGGARSRRATQAESTATGALGAHGPPREAVGPRGDATRRSFSRLGGQECGTGKKQMCGKGLGVLFL